MRVESDLQGFPYVPWVLVDGRHTDAAQQDLMAAVCQLLEAPKPSACETTSFRSLFSQRQDLTKDEFCREAQTTSSDAGARNGRKKRRKCSVECSVEKSEESQSRKEISGLSPNWQSAGIESKCKKVKMVVPCGIKSFSLKQIKTLPRNPSWPEVVGLDCEMVGGGINGSRSLLAKIAIVNEFGEVVMNEYVRPRETALMWFPEDKFVRDTSLYLPLRDGVAGCSPSSQQKASLKRLAAHWLDREVQVGAHDPVEDAQAALDLYM
ncbi:interferon-stimulated 20 kDa exonuclease-like 2 [Condylostylus longicornis]|uniref:interferon-stimulated 20 kDa exonuclease-like 2 n=1 Tax=Condylostylus longicornis TaxID=2530218 RepID=UPI00244DBF4E|nr:interferon-stimulated 20 kDa exonuclease-like 2 [Condylostylus longicornis]